MQGLILFRQKRKKSDIMRTFLFKVIYCLKKIKDLLIERGY